VPVHWSQICSEKIEYTDEFSGAPYWSCACGKHMQDNKNLFTKREPSGVDYECVRLACVTGGDPGVCSDVRRMYVVCVCVLCT